MMTLIDSVDISNPLLGGFGYTIYIVSIGTNIKVPTFQQPW
jgi:hypothetical protein